MAEAEEPTTGTRGFFQPKLSNGSWSTIEGVNCNTCDVGMPGRDGEFYEESAWSYSWFVPHDYARVIGLVGGAEEWVKRLGISYFGGADEIHFLIMGLLMLGMSLGCYKLCCIIMLVNLRNQSCALENLSGRRLILVLMVYLGTMTLVPVHPALLNQDRWEHI
jgi:Glycosyl hydrolase family 92